MSKPIPSPSKLNESPSLKTLTLSIVNRILPIHPSVAWKPHYVVQARAAQSRACWKSNFSSGTRVKWAKYCIREEVMLEPLDRCRRDSTLFQFTTKRLRDFIDPNHLLLQIDAQFNFAELVAPLEANYCPDNGRPAVYPEVLVRALLISALYNITSLVTYTPAYDCCIVL